MKISLIIFCFNESGSIRPLIASSIALMDEITEDYEIIVVDDGSTDSTGNDCREMASNSPKVKVISHPHNMGIGMAIRSGYLAAKMEYVCAIPGDGQFDLNELRSIKPFGNNTYYAFYRQRTGYNRYRQTLTWLNRIFNQHVLGIFLRDVNWVKVYRKDQIESAAPELKSSLIESEIIAKLYKCGIAPIEMPSKYLSRYAGISRGGSWKTLRKAIAELFKLWWRVICFNPPEKSRS